VNSSLWFADLTTHTKIVVVSLVAATVVTAVAISAGTDFTSIPRHVAPEEVHAGSPANSSVTHTSAKFEVTHGVDR
jgi:hypothetical protein